MATIPYSWHGVIQYQAECQQFWLDEAEGNTSDPSDEDITYFVYVRLRDSENLVNQLLSVVQKCATCARIHLYLVDLIQQPRNVNCQLGGNET
jgi:hypothetical protein